VTLRLRCSEKSISPLFKGTIYSSEENPSAGFNMLLVVETANSDRPPTGFCDELLIGSKSFSLSRVRERILSNLAYELLIALLFEKKVWGTAFLCSHISCYRR